MAQPESMEQFKEGDSVWALWDDGHWYPGTITKVSESSSEVRLKWFYKGSWKTEQKCTITSIRRRMDYIGKLHHKHRY